MQREPRRARAQVLGERGNESAPATLGTAPMRNSPVRPIGACGEVGARRLEVPGDGVGVAEQLAAGLGQLDRARSGRARHERHADDPLERPQLLADSRLRVAELRGGAAHRTLARDRLERGEVAEFEPGPFRKRADNSRSYPEFADRPAILKRFARMRILVIQHDADKGLGLFARPLAEASFELDVRSPGTASSSSADHAP